jgi:hypothetical protein
MPEHGLVCLADGNSTAIDNVNFDSTAINLFEEGTRLVTNSDVGNVVYSSDKQLFCHLFHAASGLKISPAIFSSPSNNVYGTRLPYSKYLQPVLESNDKAIRIADSNPYFIIDDKNLLVIFNYGRE